MNRPEQSTLPEAAVPSGLQPSAVRWGILAMLMALCFISHFNRASMASAGDERIMKQFEISEGRMGWIYTGFLLVYTAFMLPGGLFIDRFGPRLALALMGFSTALFCLFTGLIGWGLIATTQVWLSLMVVRSLMGLFTTPLHPACARAVSNWFPGRQCAFANGLITGAALLAYAVVHPVFGALIDRVDWPKAFMITGACTALLALGWFVWAADFPRERQTARRVAPPIDHRNTEEVPGDGTEESERGELETPPGTLSHLFRDRSLILLTLSYGAVGYFQYLFFYWLHHYFDEVLHLGKTNSRTYTALPSLAMAVGMPLGGWLIDRSRGVFGQRRGRTLVPKIGMIASACLLLSGLFARETFWIVLWFTLSLGMLGLCESAFWTTAVELGGRRGGTAAAIINVGGNGIGLLAPVVTPFVSTRLGWSAAISLGALVGFLGGACWWWIVPRTPADARDERD